MTAKSRARNGAAYLDQKSPGWRERIDVKALGMSDCRNCILGQVFGTYSIGTGVLNLSFENLVALGFSYVWTVGRSPAHTTALITALTAAWREVILELREQSNAPVRPLLPVRVKRQRRMRETAPARSDSRLCRTGRSPPVSSWRSGTRR